MNAARTRQLARALLLVLGVVIGALVYLPFSWIEPVRPVIAFVVVPGVTVTGLCMWHQGRLRRWAARRRSRSATEASR